MRRSTARSSASRPSELPLPRPWDDAPDMKSSPSLDSRSAELARPSPGLAVPLIYNAALAVASPLLLGYLSYRLLWRGKSRAGLAQRLGAAPRLGPPPRAGRLWLHAVSAGEMVAAAPILRHLRRASPDTEVIVSATTPAGRAQAYRLVPN